MKIFVSDIFKAFNIEKTQLNVIAVKSLVAAMVSKDVCIQEKQKLVFDEQLFIDCWNVYYNCLTYFDPNYNRKTDFSSFFKYILDYKLLTKKNKFSCFILPRIY